MRALEALAAWCQRYAPLTTPDRPDGIQIDATSCVHLFGGGWPCFRGSWRCGMTRHLWIPTKPPGYTERIPRTVPI